MATSQIIDRDLGWNRIKHALKLMDGSHVKVGLQEGSTHKDPESGKLSDLVVIGAVQEFGAPKNNIPERPFMRQAFDRNLSKIKLVQKKAYNGVISGRIPVKRALGIIGVFMEDRIKRRIVGLKTPANAPRTIARKKSSNPLVDTGQMRQSITSVVEMS